MEKQHIYGVSRFSSINGVTCYINSILHILQHIPEWVNYINTLKFKFIINDKIKKHIELNSNLEEKTVIKTFLVLEYYKLIKISLENENATLVPTSFKRLLGIKNNIFSELNHQDSQEFLSFLLSQIIEEIGVKKQYISYEKSINEDNLTTQDIIHIISANKVWSNTMSFENSPMKLLFTGLIEHKRKCVCCNTYTSMFEPSLTIELTIPIKEQFDKFKVFDIYECFDDMIFGEELDGDNKMECSLCGIKNKSISKTLFWKTPKVLILHIKRFDEHFNKINNNILYPIKNLNLYEYFNPISPYKFSSKYDLMGINIHHNIGFDKEDISCGHYTSFIKNQFNNKWYHYNDDATVEHINDINILQNKNAYLLFYYRHD